MTLVLLHVEMEEPAVSWDTLSVNVALMAIVAEHLNKFVMIIAVLNGLEINQFPIWNAREVELHVPAMLNAVQIPADTRQGFTSVLDLTLYALNL